MHPTAKKTWKIILGKLNRKYKGVKVSTSSLHHFLTYKLSPYKPGPKNQDGFKMAAGKEKANTAFTKQELLESLQSMEHWMFDRMDSMLKIITEQQGKLKHHCKPWFLCSKCAC